MKTRTRLWMAVAIAGILMSGISSSQSLPQVDPDKSWAVVIGVSNYTAEDVQPLEYAASDALAVAEFLMSPRGGGLRQDRVELLLEGDATAEAVRTTLGFLGEKVQDGDSVYIFIAGHGSLTPRGLGYFIPSDGTLANVYASAVNFRELKELVEENLAHSGVRVLITDICHAGRIGAEIARPTEANQNRVNDYLAKIAPDSGAFLNLLASQPHESSFESARFGQGMFTYAVLQALNGRSVQPGSPFADAKSVVEFVKAEVPRLTGNQQNPLSNSDFDPALPLAYLDRPGPVRAEPVQTTLVIQNSNRSQFERVEWVDSRYRARAVRRLPKDVETVQISSLPVGPLEFKFAGADNQVRSLTLTLQAGQNTLDVLTANLAQYRFRPAGPVQVASLEPVAVPQAPQVTASPEAVLLLKVAANTSVSIDGQSFGAGVRADEYLQLSGLAPGVHNLTLVPAPDRERRFRLRLSTGSQELNVESGELKPLRAMQQDPAAVALPAGLPPNLAGAYRQFDIALWDDRLIAPQGNSAADYFAQMQGGLPAPLLAETRERLIIAMGNRAQQTILRYLQGGDIRWTAEAFEEAAALTTRMQPFFQARPTLLQDVQSRQNFFNGRALIERGQYAQAIQALQQSIALFPDASHAFNALGLAYWKQSQLAQAVPPLQQAIALSPTWTYPRNLLALVQFELRQYNQAEQTYQQALLQTPEDSSLHHGLAQLYLLMGRAAEAETHLRSAIEFNPGNSYAHETYGRLRQRVGNLDEADRFYRLAMRLEPDEPSFRASLAGLFRQRGQTAETQQMLAGLATAYPSDIRVVRAYTDFLASQNRPADARRIFEQAVRSAPRDANLRVMYGGFLREQRQNGDAERQYRDAIQAAPSNVFAHHDLASLYLSQGRIPQAERELNLAMTADARFPNSPMLLGQIRFAQQRHADAIASYSRALELSVEPDQRQELQKSIADARTAAAAAAVVSAQGDIQRNRPRNAWSTYANTLNIAPEDRSLIDALLKFEIDFANDADVALLSDSAVALALQTPFWRALRQSEALWKQARREDAVRSFGEALETLPVDDRRKVAGTGFNVGNENYGIHQIVYRWASRAIELRDFDGALRLMESAVRQKIFDMVPGMSVTTVDSLMIPPDKPNPAAFADFDIARHPDRRAHEIFAVAYAAKGDAQRSGEFLAALNANERTVVQTAIDRLGR